MSHAYFGGFVKTYFHVFWLHECTTVKTIQLSDTSTHMQNSIRNGSAKMENVKKMTSQLNIWSRCY